MTQGELTKIWDALDLGAVVPGWGRMLGGAADKHVLIELSANHTWTREVSVGPWVKTPT